VVRLDDGSVEIRHPAGARGWWTDAAVAASVAAAQAGGTVALATHRGTSVGPTGLVLLVIAGVALVARRRFPVAVLAATYALTLAYRASDNPSGEVWLAVLIAFATAIWLRKRVAAITFLAAGYVGFLWVPVVVGHHRAPSAVFALALGCGLLVLLAVAEGVRLTRQRAAAVAHGHEQEALRRVGEERLRIARDLHDVVAHSIAVINVQANTALHLMDRQPDRARSALTTINDVSKQTLVELRAVVGVLRERGEVAPRGPSPSLRQLDELVTSAAEAGLTVRVSADGERAPLPADVDMAAYRIVQEALTNAARHSGGSSAWVRLHYGLDQLGVEVDDDGPPAGARGDAPVKATSRRGMGNGLPGMSERAEALGGRVEAGPRPGGGFRVSATLPSPGRHGASGA
jgi:signal transduction histidine kinase